MDPAEVQLLRQRAAEKSTQPSNAPSAWLQYVRFLFQADSFYKFTALSSGVQSKRYVYVAENKSLPGREHLREDEAVGRALSVVWYESEEDLGDDRVAVRCVTATPTPMASSIAQIAKAAGYHPPLPLGPDSGRDEEARIVNGILSLGVVRFSQENLVAGLFELSSPVGIEDHYRSVTPIGERTKMALARELQIQLNQTDAQRDASWILTTEALLVALGR